MPTDKLIDNPEFAKAAGVLEKVLPEGVDPMTVWSALKDAGLTISASDEPLAEGEPAADAAATSPLGLPQEAAPSGAPVDGEPQGADGGFAGMNIGGPPTDDLVRAALKATQAEMKAT